MNTPPSFAKGLLSMTASLQQYSHCNIMSNLSNVFETTIWASNIADFSLNHVMQIENNQQSAKVRINQLYETMGSIESNVTIIRQDQLNMTCNAAWLVETCIYASNGLSNVKSMTESYQDGRVGPIIEAAMFASNAYAWAGSQSLASCSPSDNIT